MKYMGSKNRIAKYILPIMLKDRKEGQWWVEPFVGGGNMIDKVAGNRLGSDVNIFLVSLLQKMQEDSFEAPIITKDQYEEIKSNQNNYPLWLVGFVGFQLTFSSQWFGSYRRDNIGKRDYALEAKRNVDRQSKFIKDVNFHCKEYDMLILPPKSLIYCDPPYQGTSGYGLDFDHKKFWQWCREKKKEGHTIFISEYNAPEDFKCVWEKELCSSLTKNTGSKKGIERLFTL